MSKRLYKSESDKKWLGICGGFAQYFDVDPVLIRALYVFLTIITGFIPGLIAYLILAWIMPSKAEVKNG